MNNKPELFIVVSLFLEVEMLPRVPEKLPGVPEKLPGVPGKLPLDRLDIFDC